MIKRIIFALFLLLLATAGARAQSDDRAAVFCERGKLLYETGKTEEADYEFRKALVIDPNNATARQYLQKIYSEKNRAPAREVGALKALPKVENQEQAASARVKLDKAIHEKDAQLKQVEAKLKKSEAALNKQIAQHNAEVSQLKEAIEKLKEQLTQASAKPAKPPDEKDSQLRRQLEDKLKSAQESLQEAQKFSLDKEIQLKKAQDRLKELETLFSQKAGESDLEKNQLKDALQKVKVLENTLKARDEELAKKKEKPRAEKAKPQRKDDRQLGQAYDAMYNAMALREAKRKQQMLEKAMIAEEAEISDLREKLRSKEVELQFKTGELAMQKYRYELQAGQTKEQKSLSP
jgi:hypothetical protein